MAVAFSNSLYREPIEATAARARAAGFRALELLVEPWESPVDEVRGALERAGVACASGVAVMRGDRDLTHPDPFLRQAAIDYLSEVLRRTAALGGRAVTVFPASHGRLAPRDSLEREHERCVEALRACDPVAREVGVRIALEPVCRFETHFLNRVEQAECLAAASGASVGVVADTFHMNIEESDWEATLRRARGSLVNVHVADNNRRPPGHGTFPWERLGAVLAEIGFQGDVIVEFSPPPGMPSEAANDRFREWMESALRTVELRLPVASEPGGAS